MAKTKLISIQPFTYELKKCCPNDRSSQMPSIVSSSRNRHGIKRAANGSQPPQSSLLAAHLAPTNGSSTSAFDPEDFALLLKESLGSDEDGQPNLGTDVTVNHKLVCVIIKAGLDTIDLLNDDTFCEDKKYHDQVLRCIEVIDLVMERTPEAIFSSTPEDLGPIVENVPLFLWLIPKLLSSLVLDRNEPRLIAENVWPLLGKILASAKKCSNSLDLCITVSTYLEELTEGTVHYVLLIEMSEAFT